MRERERKSQETPLASRTSSPDSPRASSLYDATTAIDTLVRSLADFTRVATPDSPNSLTCCCGREECEHAVAWRALKARLESRLVMSAETGLALLKRHEAYDRQLQSARSQNHPESEASTSEIVDNNDKERLEARIAVLMTENAALERRVHQALLNTEVAESSTATALQELREAQSNVNRLSAEHARSVGLDARLRSVMQEKDDLQQERDNEGNRARLAETRLSSFNAKYVKLRSQAHALQDELEQQRGHRLALSEEIVKDARLRIEELHRTHLGRTLEHEENEVSKILESLIADNETLKKDNSELQRLLFDARENLNTSQEDGGYQRGTTFVEDDISESSRFLYGTAPGPVSPIASEFALREGFVSSKRSTSTPRRPHLTLPSTPESARRPLSPPESIRPYDRRGRGRPYRSLHLDFASELDAEGDPSIPSPSEESGTSRPFMSRGTQTDLFLGLPSFPGDTVSSSASLPDSKSETSSFTDQPSTLTILLERVSQLFTRMSQADALTLTNRLKRQRLLGADVSHLSRSTIDSILSELATLRSHFRTILDDEKIVTTCTRKDLRALFKLFRDVFQELGTMRVTLNDVVLNPSIAPTVREFAMNPTKAEADRKEQEGKAASSVASGWIAPLSKLFGSSTTAGQASKQAAGPLLRSTSSTLPLARPQPRFVPKIAAATSASTTTVNVEFSGTGASRAVTNTSMPSSSSAPSVAPSAAGPTRSVSQSVMGIFAGAPRTDATADPWIVIPKAPNRLLRQPSRQMNVATLGRSGGRGVSGNGHGRVMSRNVDAVIDVQSPIEGPSGPDPSLLERTLRPRGLSDSSIHTTFMSHAEEAGVNGRDSQRAQVEQSRQSVLQMFSQKVGDIRAAASGALPGQSTAVSSPSRASHAPSSSRDTKDQLATQDPVPRAISPALAGLLPDLASWTGLGQALDSRDEEDLHAGGSRPDRMLPRHWARETYGRDI
ncbi:hypothetical protein EWM64_g892 [Hericium alpestre]|uniref:Uncharacterized protein n=1 Tax=Hericium alpestre TaxID=135208 RepID=A0A4Z0A9V1_9AGAM|nr:hypothetical protein EWM64_g892 [Hericium alpestre]